MSNIDSVREFESAWGQVRDRLVEQEERIAALERENEEMKAERDFYLQLYKEQLRKEYEKHPEEVEAEWVAVCEEAKRNPGDLDAFIRELEAETGHQNGA